MYAPNTRGLGGGGDSLPQPSHSKGNKMPKTEELIAEIQTLIEDNGALEAALQDASAAIQEARIEISNLTKQNAMLRAKLEHPELTPAELNEIGEAGGYLPWRIARGESSATRG